MHKIQKNAEIANFNCTFGENDEPMLHYFFEVILPAFSKQESSEESFLNFTNVKLILVAGEFYLSGLIVKNTYLEVMSKIVDGELKETDEQHKSNPYSLFLINLKNHRMSLVRNQKGSPTIKDFEKTAVNSIREYSKHQDNIPSFQLNVVPIPFKENIKKELEKVKKINKLTLRFYPLNGDIPADELMNDLREKLNKVSSKSGNTVFNTPKNKEGVSDLIEDTKGTVKTTLEVEYDDGVKRTLKEDSFSEKIPVVIDEEKGLMHAYQDIAGEVSNRKEFTETSEENKSIYEKFYGKLEDYYSKFTKK